MIIEYLKIKKIKSIVYDFNNYINNHREKARKDIAIVCNGKKDKIDMDIPIQTDIDLNIYADGIFIGSNNPIYRDLIEFIKNYKSETKAEHIIEDKSKSIRRREAIQSEESPYSKVISKSGKEMYYYKDPVTGKKRRVSKKSIELAGYKI